MLAPDTVLLKILAAILESSEKDSRRISEEGDNIENI